MVCIKNEIVAGCKCGQMWYHSSENLLVIILVPLTLWSGVVMSQESVQRSTVVQEKQKADHEKQNALMSTLTTFPFVTTSLA